MKKLCNSESGVFNPRYFAAFSLCLIGLSLTFISFASTPARGTVTEANIQTNPLTYTGGPFFAPNVFGNTIPGECDPDPSFPLVPCDIYKLHVQLPAGWVQANPNKRLFVRIEWSTPGARFDLYLWDAANWPEPPSFPNGDPIASSTQNATTFQQVEVAPLAVASGDYVVQVSTTLPAGQSFTGKVWIADATPGAGPILPAGNASGIAPRFQEHIPTDANGAPSASLGLIAGEPTIGINTKVNANKGGDLFYQALYEILRIRFDDSTSPAKATWEPKDSGTNISTHVTLDPIFLADPATGRLWAMQLAGGSSLTDISDDNGETWTPALSGSPGSGADHQGMGVGPYPPALEPLILHPLYPNALYYCSQDVGAAFCSRSDNGGQGWGPLIPIYTSVVTGQCVGLHGHPKVDADGTVYVPNKGCELDTPVVGNGFQSVVVSEDAGATWSVRKVPDSGGGLLAKGDPSVAFDKGGKIYFAYQNLADSLFGSGGNGSPADHMMVAVSTDKGQTFSPSVDVGALAGITHAVFPAVVAGDSGRAAVAFFGTTYAGPENYQEMTFPGVWYLYIATTYDGGDTWFVANATPDHPIQGGFAGISNAGDGRNHYDFIDAEIDTQGRIIASNSIGCAGSCVNNGGPNTFQKLAGIVRQSGGRRMYAQFDPPEPALPAPPLINGYRTSQIISFNWPEPDGSGLPITGYNVYRGVGSAPKTKILAGTTERQVVEIADPTKSYSYRVTALNALGEGSSSNTFMPAVGQNAPRPELSCNLPGQVYTDRTGEGGTQPNNDIASFGIAEPQDMPGKIVFVINNAHPELVAAANSDFYVFFDPPRGALSYKLSLTDMEVTFYKNGQFVTDCGSPPISQCRDWQHAGDLDPASGIQDDGSVWLVIDKAQFGIANGDVLLGVAVREDTVGNPSGVLSTDYAGGRQDYTVVGNDFCTKPPVPLSVVSRKTHGTKDFDVDLPVTGKRGVECRAGDPKLIFTFAFPITDCGTATQGLVNRGPTDYQCTVNLPGLTNGQNYQVGLNGVVSSTGGSGNIAGPQWGLLLGDVNGNGLVNSTDTSITQSVSGRQLSESNFRADVNANAVINSTDTSIVQSKSGTGLPAN